ncbi:MAG: hypothetical protein VYA48_02945, partial [Gemmatimonadota bacterium]|nr:hypothetical protein [Gemmatimonadota bacterium]
IPSVFDEEMSLRGHPMRSFNAGFSAMGNEEHTEITRRIRDLALPKLEWIVSDVTIRSYLRFERDNPMKARTIEWHSWRNLMRVFRYYRATNGRTELWTHVRHTLARSANLGLGALWLTGQASLSPPILTSAPDFFSTPAGARHKRRGRKGVSKEKHRELIDRYETCAKAKPQISREVDRALEIHTAVSDLGFRSVLLIAPVSYRCTAPEWRDDAGLPVTVLSFNDPERYPALYSPPFRLNDNHLNYAGAVRYSKVLAMRISAILDREREASRPSRR